MSSNIELVSESLSGTQLSIAVGVQEKEIGRIEAETIGWKWNARQKHMLHILGVRALHADDSKSIEPLTVKTFETIFVEEMEVTLPTIQADIKALEDAEMIEKPYLNGSKKTKKVQLTAQGFSLWKEYANKRAALVYAMHDALNKTGGLPETWRSKVGKWVALLVGDKAKAAAVALMCLGIAGAPDEAKAEFTSFAPLVVQKSIVADSYVEGATWKSGVDVSAMAKFQEIYVDGVDVDYFGTEPSFRMASTEGLYDRLLPKLVAVMEVKSDNSLTSADHFNSAWDWKNGTLNAASFDEQVTIKANSFESSWPQANSENAASYQMVNTESLYDRLLPKAAASMVVNYSQ